MGQGKNLAAKECAFLASLKWMTKVHGMSYPPPAANSPFAERHIGPVGKLNEDGKQ